MAAGRRGYGWAERLDWPDVEVWTMAEEASLFPTESGMCGKMRKQTIIQVTNESLNPDQHRPR